MTESPVSLSSPEAASPETVQLPGGAYYVTDADDRGNPAQWKTWAVALCIVVAIFAVLALLA